MLSDDIQFPWNIGGQSTSPANIGPATIKKEHLDPVLLKEVDDLKRQVIYLTKLVNQLYYPYRSHE